MKNFLKEKGIAKNDIPKNDESLYYLLTSKLQRKEVLKIIKRYDSNGPQTGSKKILEDFLVNLFVEKDSSEESLEETEVKKRDVTSEIPVKQNNPYKREYISEEGMTTPLRPKKKTIISPEFIIEEKNSRSVLSPSLKLSKKKFNLEDFKNRSKSIAKDLGVVKEGEKKLFIKRSRYVELKNIVKCVVMIDVEEHNKSPVWGYKADIMQVLYHTLADMYPSMSCLKNLSSYSLVAPGDDPSKVLLEKGGYGRTFVGGVIEFPGSKDNADKMFHEFAELIHDIHTQDDFQSIYISSAESANNSPKFVNAIKNNMKQKSAVGNMHKLILQVQNDVPLNQCFVQLDVCTLMNELFGALTAFEEEWTEEQKLVYGLE